jgi:hypothetical protein
MKMLSSHEGNRLDRVPVDLGHLFAYRNFMH